MSRYTIGVDLGTTGTKAVLVDVTGRLVGEASRPSSLLSPFPGAAEADPAQWRRNAVETVRELLTVSGVDAAEVLALAATGMLPAVVVTDRTGAPLRPAILQNDTRAGVEVQEIAAVVAHLDPVRTTGSAVTQQSAGPKLLWLRRHEPDVFARTHRVLGSYDWLLTEFGADPHVELNWAIESGLVRLSDQSVIDDVARAAGISGDLLPPVAAPGTVVGGLSRALAEETGLREGTPLVVGGADHVLSAFAAGVESEGDWLVKLGGAGDILVASDRPIVDDRFYLDAHPVPGLWLPNGCMATSGSLVKWLQGVVGGPSFDELEREAAPRPAADLLCLPYFLGEKSPLHDPDLRGAYVGLHLGHTRADLYRATMEAIAFGFRHHADVFAQIGLHPRRVIITNGGSRSRLWKQIHADVLGHPVIPVARHPGASLGAAIAAAVGVGARDSWACVHDFLALEPPIDPDPDRAAIYDAAYPRWRELGAVLEPVSHAHVAATRTGDPTPRT